MFVPIDLVKLSLDSIDLVLIGRLTRDGRATWVDLASEAGLTPPAVAARVRHLEETGVIRQFAALVSPAAVDVVTAFIDLTFDSPDGHEEFRQTMGRLVAVQECHRIAGGSQYRLKVRTRSTAELDALLTTVIAKAAPGADVRVSMVLSTIKESPVFPLPRPAVGPARY